jgi:hypothetical protein
MHGGDPKPAAITAERSRWPRAEPGHQDRSSRGTGLLARTSRPSLTRSVQEATAPAGRAGPGDLNLSALPAGPCRELEGPWLPEPASGGTSSDAPGRASRPRALRALCWQRHCDCNLRHNGPHEQLASTAGCFWLVVRGSRESACPKHAASPPWRLAPCVLQSPTPTGSAYCRAPGRALLQSVTQRRPGLCRSDSQYSCHSLTNLNKVA